MLDEKHRDLFERMQGDIAVSDLLLPPNTIERASAQIEAGLQLFERAVEQDPRLLFSNFREAFCAIACSREIGPQLAHLLRSNLQIGIGGGFSRSGKTVTAQVLCDFVRQAGGSAETISMEHVGTAPPEQLLVTFIDMLHRMSQQHTMAESPLDLLVVDEAGTFEKIKRAHGYGLPQFIAHLSELYPGAKIVTINVFYRNWRMQHDTGGDYRDFLPRNFLEPDVQLLREHDFCVAGLECKDCWALDTFEFALAAYTTEECLAEEVKACARELFATSSGNPLVFKTIIDIVRDAEGDTPLLGPTDLDAILTRFIRINEARSRLADPLNYEGIEKIIASNGFSGFQADRIAHAIKWAFSGYPSPLFAAKNVNGALGYSSSVTPDMSILGKGPEKGLF